MTTGQEIIERLFADQLIPEHAIPSIILCVMECDTLRHATVQELEVIGAELESALLNHNLAVEAMRAVKYLS
jgi:hypothetical protein